MLTSDDVRRLAAYVQRIDAKWGRTKWSILVSSDVAYGLSRMFIAHTSDFEVTTNVFRTLAEADDWLGLGRRVTSEFKIWLPQQSCAAHTLHRRRPASWPIRCGDCESIARLTCWPSATRKPLD